MSMKFRVQGEGKIDLAEELIEEFIPNARTVVREASDILLAETKRLIAAYGRGPAPPGSTPGTETGNLLKLTKRGSVRMGRDKTSVSGAVLWPPHAHLVEYGHTNVDGTRTLPRPFIRPALDAAEPKIQRLFEERL
jgi:hypothetical protein